MAFSLSLRSSASCFVSALVSAHRNSPKDACVDPRTTRRMKSSRGQCCPDSIRCRASARSSLSDTHANLTVALVGSVIGATAGCVSRRDARRGKKSSRQVLPVSTVESQCASVAHLTLQALHAPVPERPSDLAAWAERTFEVVNDRFFQGQLRLPGGISVDTTWHLRGGAGGAHPGRGCIVLDPSVHSSLRDLAATLLHEIVHISVGSQPSGTNDEEHGPAFIENCIRLNEAIACDDAVCCSCRLGELDLAVDGELLDVAGLAPSAVASLVASAQSPDVRDCDRWDEGLLVADLRAVGADDATIKRVLLSCATVAARRALASPGGFSAWDIRSRTLGRHFAIGTQRTRDYRLFTSCRALWEV